MKVVEKKIEPRKKKIENWWWEKSDFHGIWRSSSWCLEKKKKKWKSQMGNKQKSWGYIGNKKWECVFYTWDWEKEPFVCVSFDVDDEEEVREYIYKFLILQPRFRARAFSFMRNVFFNRNLETYSWITIIQCRVAGCLGEIGLSPAHSM